MIDCKYNGKIKGKSHYNIDDTIVRTSITSHGASALQQKELTRSFPSPNSSLPLLKSSQVSPDFWAFPFSLSGSVFIRVLLISLT
jgi:hypothetical protein